MGKLTISERTKLSLKGNDVNLFFCPDNCGLELMMITDNKGDGVQETLHMIADMVVEDNPEFVGCLFLYASFSNASLDKGLFHSFIVDGELDVDAYASLFNSRTLVYTNGPKKGIHYAKSCYTLYKDGEKPSQKRILYGDRCYKPDDAH